jgi:DNA-binding MarR family transcriptional regulator
LPSQVLRAQAQTAQAAWLKFLRAHAAVTRELSARIEAEHGLTLTDYDVLAQLFHADGNRLRRIDLARQVLLTASGITRLLDGLERAGWVEKARCDSDQRVTYAVLTAEGLAKITAARKTHHADVRELFGCKFSDEELGTLDELLSRLPLADTECAK